MRTLFVATVFLAFPAVAIAQPALSDQINAVANAQAQEES